MKKFGLSDFEKHRPLTVQYLTWLLFYKDIIHHTEYERIQLTLNQNNSSFLNLETYSQKDKIPIKCDKRDREIIKPCNLSNLKLYTDYPFFNKIINENDFEFQKVDTAEEADFLYIITQVSDFYAIDQRLSQFPFEGALVQKVLLYYYITILLYYYNLILSNLFLTY